MGETNETKTDGKRKLNLRESDTRQQEKPNPYDHLIRAIEVDEEPPTFSIVQHPQSQEKGERGYVTFRVEVIGGTGPYSYQWRKNGIAIEGATKQSYDKRGLMLTDEGQYSVEVTIHEGTSKSQKILSNSAQLSIISNRVTNMTIINAGTFQTKDKVQDPLGKDAGIASSSTTLTYDFLIGKYEVSFGEFDAFCISTKKRKPGSAGWGRGNRPTINVTWWDAVSYCNWVSEREGIHNAYNKNGNLLDKTGKVTADITKVIGYRLPTEAEWVYAASGGLNVAKTKYAGNDILYAVAWYKENSRKKTHPVGQKKANELGLHDMTGNVWEWCTDWYDDKYYGKGMRTNPTGPDSGFYRVLKGGCWGSDSQYCRLAFRLGCSPTFKYFNLGFRIAKTYL